MNKIKVYLVDVNNGLVLIEMREKGIGILYAHNRRVAKYHFKKMRLSALGDGR